MGTDPWAAVQEEPVQVLGAVRAKVPAVSEGPGEQSCARPAASDTPDWNERSERDTALLFTHHTIGGCRSAWFLVIHLISAMATNAVMIDAPMIASPHSTHDGSTAITLLLEPSVHSVYPKRFFSISAKPEAFRGALG